MSKIIAGSPFVTDEQKKHVDFYFEQSETTHQNAQNLLDTLYANAIYFESEVYKEVAEFSQLVMGANSQLLKVMRRVPPEYLTSESVLQEIKEERSNIEKILDNRLQSMHFNLLIKFRKILGVEKKYNQSLYQT